MPSAFRFVSRRSYQLITTTIITIYLPISSSFSIIPLIHNIFPFFCIFLLCPQMFNVRPHTQSPIYTRTPKGNETLIISKKQYKDVILDYPKFNIANGESLCLFYSFPSYLYSFIRLFCGQNKQLTEQPYQQIFCPQVEKFDPRSSYRSDIGNVQQRNNGEINENKTKKLL